MLGAARVTDNFGERGSKDVGAGNVDTSIMQDGMHLSQVGGSTSHGVERNSLAESQKEFLGG